MAAADVVQRHIFYNNSRFDGNDPADDAAIAPDKQALLPGQTADFANYTSYSRGINGIMVDIAGLPEEVTLTAADFAFRMGKPREHPVSAWILPELRVSWGVPAYWLDSPGPPIQPRGSAVRPGPAWTGP
jgi:hypothetical protein